MYRQSNMPNRLPGTSPERRVPRPRRLSSTGFIVVLGTLLAIAVAALWLRDGGARSGLAGAADDMAADAARLWDWANAELAGGSAGASWAARWDAELDGAQVERIAAALELAEAGSSGLSREAPSYRLALWLERDGHAAAGGPSQAVLLLEGRAGFGRSELLALLREADKALEGGKLASSSISFRGTAADERAAARIAKAAGAVEAERYEDGGTVSVSYYTKSLAAEPVGAGVNLQLASRYDPLIRHWRVAGGIPLVTGDYAPTVDLR